VSQCAFHLKQLRPEGLHCHRGEILDGQCDQSFQHERQAHSGAWQQQRRNEDGSRRLQGFVAIRDARS